jgi:uncharacterized protein (TIGR03492 family)
LRPDVGALHTIAPTLEAERFERALRSDGWEVAPADGDAPFTARAGAAHLIAWRGPLGELLAASEVVLGQAGTANEQAAALGLPVIALGVAGAESEDWYRMRQRRLLGDALLLVPPEPELGAAAIAGLLGDERRLEDMRAAGRARMGGRGGAAAIARELLELA